MKRIKYICITDLHESKFKRRTVPAATTKIDYIVSALNKAGYGVDIISVAESEGKSFGLSKTETIELGINTLTRFGCLSIPWTKVARRISTRQVVNKFIHYLSTNIKSGDIVIAYHSPRYFHILRKLREKLNFCLIGEIEEIYQDIKSLGIKYNKEEYAFIKVCDKYIFPTQLLNDKLNPKNHKKSIIIHGIYKAEPNLNLHFYDDKIHIIYAGTFAPQKGAEAAATSALYLTKNYHIHILGFGTNKEVDQIKQLVKNLQSEAKATISYDGFITGKDFIRFIQKCEIGLSTQSPNATFNSTSFPSKILTYLANGLKVVTIDIPSIRSSAVGNHLFYYKDQTPQEIAKAIKMAHEQQNFNGRLLLEGLNKVFIEDIKTFLL